MTIKKILLATVLPLLSTALFASPTVNNYTALKAALSHGKAVQAMINVDKCVLARGSNTRTEKTRDFKITNTHERMAHEAGSKGLHLITVSAHDYVGNQRDGVNVARSLLRIFENGKVEVVDQQFSMETASFSDESVLQCHLTADGSGGVLLTS